MIKPFIEDLDIYIANDFSFVFDIEQTDGTVLPLTGYSAYAQARASNELTGTLVITFSVSINASHEVTLSLTDTQTRALTPGDYFYDVLLVSPGGVDQTYVSGVVTVHDTTTDKTI